MGRDDEFSCRNTDSERQEENLHIIYTIRALIIIVVITHTLYTMIADLLIVVDLANRAESLKKEEEARIKEEERQKKLLKDSWARR